MGHVHADVLEVALEDLHADDREDHDEEGQNHQNVFQHDEGLE